MLRLFYALYYFLHLVYPIEGHHGETNHLKSEEIQDFYLRSMKELISNYSQLEVEGNIFPFPSEIEVRFFLFTSDPHNYEELFTGNDSSITNSSFDPLKETKILVHGWLSNGLNDFSFEMTSAFLDNKNCNVITTDWPSFALYSIARSRVKEVSNKLSDFLNFLVDDIHVNVSQIHLLGHSLGAHIAGLAGQQVKKGKLPRITGLDPAGPLFFESSKKRLHRSQADFVDVIHTGGNLIGYYKPLGHIDFYPNGGTPVQPGCGFDLGICSHCRSYQYYIGSLYNYEPTYLASKCENYLDFQNGACCDMVISMGENINKSARGQFFLYTREILPFGFGNRSIPENCWHHLNENSVFF